MTRKFIEPYYQDILDDATIELKPATRRMLILLSQWVTYQKAAESEWLTRIGIERWINALITKLYHKNHKFPPKTIHIYKEWDMLEWTDWMRPSDTIKSLKLTSSVLAKLNTGRQSDILSLI